jgi:hypothetical protein
LGRISAALSVGKSLPLLLTKLLKTKYFSREIGVFFDDFRQIGWQLDVGAANSDGPGKILP